MSGPNTIQGKNYTLEFYDPSDSLWKLIGGLTNREMSFDSPVADVTSQSTGGDMSESDFVGYSDFSINGSGMADIRDTASLAGYQRFSAACQTGTRRAILRLKSTLVTHQGEFNITNFADTAEEKGLVNISFTAQIACDYVRT